MQTTSLLDHHDAAFHALCTSVDLRPTRPPSVTEAFARVRIRLSGKPSGGGLSCRCPCHHDKTRSLSVWIDYAGKLALHCHAGCAHADLVDCLTRWRLWPGGGRMACGDLARHRQDMGAYVEEQQRLSAALWTESVPLAEMWLGSQVETPGAFYLRHWRGLSIRPEACPHLRWHWRERAVIALMTGPLDRAFRGVQELFLSPTTNRKLYPRMIGPHGVVRLIEPDSANADGPLLIGEGIETVLSAALLWREAGCSGLGAWAVCGAENLPKLQVPPGRRVVLLVDHDRSRTGERKARQAADRLAGLGCRVNLAFPPDGAKDFNDLHIHPRGRA